jgi:hypothetical protein
LEEEGEEEEEEEGSAKDAAATPQEGSRNLSSTMRTLGRDGGGGSGRQQVMGVHTSVSVGVSMGVVAAAVRADPSGGETLRFTISAADLAAVFGSNTTRPASGGKPAHIVMEQVHGSWETPGAEEAGHDGAANAYPSGEHDRNDRNATIVRRVSVGEDLRYEEQLGPRAIRFLRIRLAPSS